MLQAGFWRIHRFGLMLRDKQTTLGRVGRANACKGVDTRILEAWDEEKLDRKLSG
jgi:hypothetical protein